MLDEAHERTLYTDIIVGLLKKVGTWKIPIFVRVEEGEGGGGGGGGGGVVCDLEHMQPLGSGW